MENVFRFLENKTILITGGTGFLAKIFVEKILRVQPNVKKLYLLFRASDKQKAKQRMQNEVIEKEVFRVVREKWGANFDSLIKEKVVAVPGDIKYENLGVQDFNLREEMFRSIDVIVNSAATTDFYDRYDVSLDINTLGVVHVLNFAKQCVKLKMLLHVSTAYVCGEGEGLILESALHMGQKLKPTCSSKLDYKLEKKLVAEKLNELRSQDLPEDVIASAMSEYGMKRAKMFGWPNSYVFTKAMGEMCAGEAKDELPIVIIRPAMVTSTYKEPFPGWIEGLRTVDSVIVGYGKGKVTCFLASPTLVFDLIPADMVVNAMMVAMVSHAKDKKGSGIIYHVGSSMRNPINITMLRNFTFKYFVENPLINKLDGKPIKVVTGSLLPNMAAFRIYMLIRFIIPLLVLQLVNVAFFQYFEDLYKNSKKKINLVIRLVELYRPYLLFKGIFDDINSEKLRVKARESCIEVDAFNFDPKTIDWEDYIMNVHIPGLKKYVIR
ncbi:hypothetical protein FNV43_RR05544 [Rhamnella rubrinervis]|uniref:Fatty acyl-CoA reductase n=1 Tax=Rhamnella rubrinervis TaxID=2594499 RepID=A0A8K0HMA6_9ROSA|nr:hypothetical protein FNV43_RR05544 [Rhamnella rubrinervis]